MRIVNFYIGLIFFLGAIIFLLSVYLVIQRYFYLRRMARKEKAHKKLEPLVLEFVFDETIAVNHIRSRLDDETEFLCLKDICMNFIAHVQGAAKDRLVHAYKELGLLEKDIEDIRSGKWWIQGKAARCIGAMRMAEAAPYLTLLINSPRVEVRMMTGYALGRIGDVRAVRLLLKETAESGKWIRIRLFELAENMRDKALPELRRILANLERPEMISLCIEVLGHAKDAESAPYILPFCNHPVTEVRTSAAKALGEIRYHPARETLVSMLDDERWEVRALASKALAGIGDASVLEKLAEKLTDSQWWVRYNAAIALSQLKVAGIKKLASVLRDSPDRFARDIARQVLEEVAFSE